MTDWLQFSHIYNEQNQIRNSCLDLLSNLSVSNSGSRVPWQLKKCLTDFYRECKRVPLTWSPNDVPLSAKCVNFCLASPCPCACATSDRLFMWDDAVEFAPLPTLIRGLDAVLCPFVINKTWSILKKSKKLTSVSFLDKKSDESLQKNTLNFWMSLSDVMDFSFFTRFIIHNLWW